MVDPMNIYGDIFSEIYNLYWTEYIDIVGPQIIAIYEEMRSIDEKKPRILDLCCGTGRLAKIFLEKGYSVIGIDLSPDMIAVANRKTVKAQEEGRVEFRVGNAIDFELDQQVPLVVSTFDSLNHLANYKELQACFEHVYAALEDDGVFMFDLNTEKGLKQWSFVDLEENATSTFIIHADYDPIEQKAYSKVIGFKKRGECYEKFEEKMYNTVFRIHRVKDMLESVGFEDIYTTTEMDLTQVTNDPEAEDRTFIICKKE